MNKLKIKVMYFSEDFATVGEAGYWQDDANHYSGKSFVTVDRIYCGENDKNTGAKCEEWESKLAEKYEIEK